MDMSVCEDADLSVSDTAVPREELLHSRTDDVFDVPEYASDIYQYLRQAEVCMSMSSSFTIILMT